MTNCQTYLLEKEGKEFILKVHYDSWRDTQVASAMSKADCVEMWMQEAGLLKQIEPIASRLDATNNVPKLLSHYPADGTVDEAAFIILEKSPETPLSERMTPLKPLADEVELKTALRGFLKGLAVIHQAQRAHRDINENNLLFSEHGTVIDLNFSRPASASVALSMMTRTGYTYPPYALGGFGQRLQSADLYALGVTLIAASLGVATAQLITPSNLDANGYLRAQELTSNMSKELSQFFVKLCAKTAGSSFKSPTQALIEFDRRVEGGLPSELAEIQAPQSLALEATKAIPPLAVANYSELSQEIIRPISAFREITVDHDKVKERQRQYWNDLGVPEDISPGHQDLRRFLLRYEILKNIGAAADATAASGKKYLTVIAGDMSRSGVIKPTDADFHYLTCITETVNGSTELVSRKLFGFLRWGEKEVTTSNIRDASDIKNVPLKMLVEDLIGLGYKLLFEKETLKYTSDGNYSDSHVGYWGLQVVIQ